MSHAELERVGERLSAVVPPQNLEAEESVLGAMLLSPVAVGTVSEILDASDFYRESHAKIYRAALALWSKGEPVDAITLANELEERAELEAAGGQARVAELAALVPGGVERRALRAHRQGDVDAPRAHPRGPGDRAARPGARCRGRGEVADLVDRAEQIVFELGQQRSTSDFAHIQVLLKESFERITQLYEAGVEITGVPAGFRELDLLTSGFQPGNLVILAARPSMGKSGARPLHRRQPRRAPPDPGGPVHARDVEVRGDAADDVQRGEGRVAATAHGPARSGRLAAADCRVRPAHEGADLRRRHGLDLDHGAALEGAAAEVA